MQVEGVQDLIFPDPQLLNSTSSNDSAMLYIPASITLPEQLFEGQEGEMSVANLLVMNVDQFFPTGK